MLFASFDNPCAANPLFPLLWGLAAFASLFLPWRRLFLALDSVVLPSPRRPLAAAAAPLRALLRALLRAISALRAAVAPEREERRALGRVLAELPPRSGLTRREELLEELSALPPGPMRLALRAEIRACVRETPEIVRKARDNAGHAVVSPYLVAALLRGEKPYRLSRR